MSKLTIIDNEYASLWYHPETKIVHHKIKKYILGQQLHDLLNAGTEQLKKKWSSEVVI